MPPCRRAAVNLPALRRGTPRLCSLARATVWLGRLVARVFLAATQNWANSTGERVKLLADLDKLCTYLPVRRSARDAGRPCCLPVSPVLCSWQCRARVRWLGVGGLGCEACGARRSRASYSHNLARPAAS